MEIRVQLNLLCQERPFHPHRGLPAKHLNRPPHRGCPDTKVLGMELNQLFQLILDSLFDQPQVHFCYEAPTMLPLKAVTILDGLHPQLDCVD